MNDFENKDYQNEEANDKNEFIEVDSEVVDETTQEEQQQDDHHEFSQQAQSEENSRQDSYQSYEFYYGEQKPKKTKKVKPWIVTVASALVICLFVGTVFAFNMTNKDGTEGSGETVYHSSPVSGDTTGATNISNTEQFIPNGTELSTAEIAAKVGPAVVGVINNGSRTSLFQQSTQQASGSGVIINENGYIVTNNHVIEGASSVTVILNTGKEYDAQIIGADSRSDLAVLKIEETGLTYAVIGDSSKAMVGEKAVAIGNPLGTELMGTVTQGIISAVNRTVVVDNKTMTLLQTDAAINSGNSGGALVNAYGELIGINTVKIEGTGVEGIGFAIPTDEMKPIVQDLIDYGYVRGRLVIGVSGTNINSKIAAYYDLPEGFFVNEVSPGSGAEEAGIQPGDVIIKCDGQVVKDMEEINAIRDTHQVGDTMTIDVVREGQVKTFQVKLQEEKPASSSR